MVYAIVKLMKGRKVMETSTLVGNREAVNKKFYELNSALGYKDNQYYKFVNKEDHKAYESWAKENQQY